MAETVAVKIVSRYDSERVLFECEVPADVESGMRTRYALERAVERDANLSGANLSDANLRDAYLGGANLSDAYLGDAYLGGANLSGANLSGANLRDANLSGANLSDAYLGDAYLGGANLSGANLGGANLRDAYLSGANLSGANLGGANLSDAYLSGAYLSDAYLRDANLSGANLSGANLRDAYLSGANLSDAYLQPIKTDFFDVLLRAPREVPALRAALVAGRVDGSTYSGECACLVGTIANARQADYMELGNGISPDSGRPIESFFMSIRKGDTPETNAASKVAVEWVDEFMALLANIAAPIDSTKEAA